MPPRPCLACAGGRERVARGRVRLPQRHVQPAAVRPARGAATSSRTAPRRGRWCRGPCPQFDRRDAAPGRRVVRPADGAGGWTRGHEGYRSPSIASVLERGQQRYRIFCTPCHGELGDGQGMIVKRGFTPPPPFTSEQAAQRAAGTLLRGDHARPRGDVLLCLARPAPRPMGHRGLHPGLAARPARDRRGPARRGPRPAQGRRRHERDARPRGSPTTRCGRGSTGSRRVPCRSAGSGWPSASRGG